MLIVQKVFLGEIFFKVAIFWGKKNSQVVIFRQWRIIGRILLYGLADSSCVDTVIHKSTYLTKLRKKLTMASASVFSPILWGRWSDNHSQEDFAKFDEVPICWQNTLVVPERFQHKWNYLLFCRIFEKLFVTCAKIFIKLKICKFRLSGLNWTH